MIFFTHWCATQIRHAHPHVHGEGACQICTPWHPFCPNITCGARQSFSAAPGRKALSAERNHEVNILTMPPPEIVQQCSSGFRDVISAISTQKIPLYPHDFSEHFKCRMTKSINFVPQIYFLHIAPLYQFGTCEKYGCFIAKLCFVIPTASLRLGPHRQSTRHPRRHSRQIRALPWQSTRHSRRHSRQIRARVLVLHDGTLAIFRQSSRPPGRNSRRFRARALVPHDGTLADLRQSSCIPGRNSRQFAAELSSPMTELSPNSYSTYGCTHRPCRSTPGRPPRPPRRTRCRDEQLRLPGSRSPPVDPCSSAARLTAE